MPKRIEHGAFQKRLVRLESELDGYRLRYQVERVCKSWKNYMVTVIREADGEEARFLISDSAGMDSLREKARRSLLVLEMEL